jgi:hypothetical protein
MHGQASVTSVALAPGVGSTELVDGIRSVLTACYLCTKGKFLAFAVIDYALWLPSSLLVADSELAIDIEAPHVEMAFLRKGSSVAETSRAGM